MTTTLTTTVEDAIAIPSIEALREEASHWLEVAINEIPLQGDPEDIAMGLWHVMGGRYRSLPEWMQDAARAAWDDRCPAPYAGRRKRGMRRYMESKALWSASWGAFVTGRHDT